jgi:transposase InsO family protein
MSSCRFGRGVRGAVSLAERHRPPLRLAHLAESFFATLECELLDRRDWPTHQALRTAVFDFIEVFYNRQRRHSTLDYASPTTYERKHHTSTAPAG